MRKIYLASSWRNPAQPSAVAALRKAGHQVYDFRNPCPGNDGFHWTAIDHRWKDWTPRQFIQALSHPVAVAGFESDFNAMEWADTGILLMPCGRSAHLELGWMASAGKATGILLAGGEPELMYGIADILMTSMTEVVRWLDGLSPRAMTGGIDEQIQRSGQ